MAALKLWLHRESWPKEMTRVFIGFPGKMWSAGRSNIWPEFSRAKMSLPENLEDKELFTQEEIICYDNEAQSNSCVARKI